MFRKRRFKVIVTVVGEETHEFTAFARNEVVLFNKLRKRNWIKYLAEQKSNGKISIAAYYIQLRHVIDIYIKPE